MLPVPMSAVVAFGVARSEEKREEIVCRVKYKLSDAGGGWGNPNAGFLKCLRESGHPSMVEDVQKNCLNEWVNRGNCKERVRRERLHDSLNSQWDRHGYKFYKVDEYLVTVAGLTIKAEPDIGMQTRSGRRATVKLWLQARPIPRMRRKLVIGLLGAPRKQGVLTGEVSPVGVWGMRQGDFEPVDTVSADVRATTQSVVEQFCRVHDRV